MFSDRYRTIKIAGLFLLLLSLAWYSARRNRYLTLEQCLEDPRRYAGRELTVFPEPRILEVTASYIRISQPGGPLEIRVPEGFDGVYPAGAKLSDLKPGDSLELAAVFRLPGHLELLVVRGAPLRRYKILLSIVAVFGVGFFLLRTVRWERGFLVLKSGPSDSSDPSDNFEL